MAFFKVASQIKYTVKKINLIFNFDVEHDLRIINTVTLNTCAFIIISFINS
jgi:hypothetical protein